jgi:hypothetical protein
VIFRKVQVMIWRGQTLNTNGEWVHALETIHTPEEGEEFLRLARADGVMDCDLAAATVAYFRWNDGLRVRRLLGIADVCFGQECPEEERVR